MQFIQPTGLYPSGFPNYGYPNGFNNTPTPLQANVYPEILGEGNVTSFITTDGSTQLVFIPTVQWLRPYLPNCNIGNLNNPYLNSMGAWFVRSIYDQLQPTEFRQPYQVPCVLQNCRAANSNCQFNVPEQRFQLKFHNDTCTSTSDIHYFFPKRYNWLQKQTQCAAVQVEAPPTSIIRDPVLCAKPCNCICTAPCRCDTKDKPKVKCKCAKLSNTSNSEMSIEGSKSDISSRRKSKGKKLHNKRNRNKSNKSNVQCQCPKMAADKSVTTYADKESCTAEKGPQFRADCNRSSSTSVVCGGIPVHIIRSKNYDKKIKFETDVRTPTNSFSERAMSTSSETIGRQSKRPCSSGSCSCSETEYEE